jgi:uncharacterized protein YegP (UPF0339 family)
LEKFEDRSGGFRWRLRASNGKIIADSAEAYSSASALNRAVGSVLDAFRSKVEVVEVG